MIKVRSKYKKQDRFYEFEIDKETEDDIQFWEEESQRGRKGEEEKQQEFRELSVTVLDALFQRSPFISEKVKSVEEEVKKQSEYKELLEELERGKTKSSHFGSIWKHFPMRRTYHRKDRG